MTTLSERYALLRHIARLPVAHLLFDSNIEKVNVVSTYRYYTKRHPKYRLIQHKSWGAALIDLHGCPSADQYLACIKGKNCGAHHAKRARARGYVLREIDRNEHIDAIHEINNSVEQRQGRPMDQKYQDKQERYERLANFRYFGVLSAEGKLMAYANVGRYGNFCSFSQLIGYRNNDGIMHLLVSEIVISLINEGKVRYLMYDTFFGALPGLQQFKTILGFQPYRARYTLK